MTGHVQPRADALCRVEARHELSYPITRRDTARASHRRGQSHVVRARTAADVQRRAHTEPGTEDTTFREWIPALGGTRHTIAGCPTREIARVVAEHRSHRSM